MFSGIQKFHLLFIQNIKVVRGLLAVEDTGVGTWMNTFIGISECIRIEAEMEMANKTCV